MVTRSISILALTAAAWATVLWLAGGVRFSILIAEVRSSDPVRPLVFAILLIVALCVIRRRDPLRDVLRDVASAIPPRALGIILAVLTFLTAMLTGSDVAGGADAYGYVSQAELWLSRQLSVSQPWAVTVPWPNGQWTFTPLGYRPSLDGTAIVPTYSPGLPLLIAGFKTVIGQCGTRVLIPLTAATLVAVTFLVGSRVASRQIGAAAAWLVATSPVLWQMTASPMSDVPTAAFWGLATLGCIAATNLSLFFGGVAAAVAILIRPNLVPVGAVLAVWLLLRNHSSTRISSRLLNASIFAVPIVIAAASIGYFNYSLYGSPTSSGYGDVQMLFGVKHIGTNIVRYASWLAEVQTPLAPIALIALWIPVSRVRATGHPIRSRSILSVLTASIVMCYLLYTPWDAWWYLRFLLPCWPAMCIAMSAIVLAKSTLTRKALIVGIGLYCLWFSAYMAAFAIGADEQRYIAIAQHVRERTEAKSVILSLQHSGSVRHYGGRLTLRYDMLEDAWLDRAVQWLIDEGFHPYILLDDWEEERFRARFRSSGTSGQLNVAQVLEHRGGGITTRLYDSLKTPGSVVPEMVLAPGTRNRQLDCVGPADPPVPLR